MAPRAISGGTISFGLVNIPVKLFPAASPKASISFKMLSKDGHKLKQQYIDPKDEDRVVPRSEMVKGYEVEKDKYLLFTPEELSELQEKSTQRIEIEEFVPEEEVPRVFFDKTYYLGPDKGAGHPYQLLGKAMRETGRCGLARYAARGKMYLVLIAPAGDDAIAMHQLHYADELVDVKDIETGDAEVKDEELAMATQLIQQIAKDRFEPDKYEDEVRKRTERLIEQKRQGESIVGEAETEEPEAGVTDIMAALRASLEQGAAKEGSEAEAKPAKKKRRSKKAS